MEKELTKPRISVEDGLQAYRVTGLTPIHGTWWDKERHSACGLGAYWKAGLLGEGDDPQDLAALKFGAYYVSGFITGFDNGLKIPKGGFPGMIPRRFQGLEDGAALRAAVDRKEHLKPFVLERDKDREEELAHV